MSALQNAEKKLQNITNTQEGIQSMSLWVNHHRAHHQKIVDTWLKVMKKCKVSHRLTLFNLCNDVVQTCKKKKAVVYKDSFREVLKEAVPFVRDSSIKSNVERIFKIWEERGVYESSFCEELLSLLANAKPAVSKKVLANFKPQRVLEKMLTFRKFEIENELKKTQLNASILDTSLNDALAQVKDRQYGQQFGRQYEESCQRTEEYVACLQQEIRDRSGLTELLEHSELYYDAQYGEARIVANAYKNFGSRVSNMKRRLDALVAELPKGPSPIPSPTQDAPSPGNTPPTEKNKLDIHDAVDMDLSEEEVVEVKPAPSSEPPIKRKRKKSNPVEDAEAEIPGFGDVVSLSEPAPQPPRTDDWNTTAISTPAAQQLWGTTTDNQPSAGDDEAGTASGNDYSMEAGGSTPVKDERPGTPVQDELQSVAPTVVTTVAAGGPVVANDNMEAAVKSNPMEFLSQLISQTQQTESSQQSNIGSNDFLQSLTALSQQAQQQQPDEMQRQAANTWAQWKAQSHDEPPTPHMGASHVMAAPPTPTGVPPPNIPPPSLQTLQSISSDTNIRPPNFSAPVNTGGVGGNVGGVGGGLITYNPSAVPTSPVLYSAESPMLPQPPTPQYSNTMSLPTPPIKPVYGMENNFMQNTSQWSTNDSNNMDGNNTMLAQMDNLGNSSNSNYMQDDPGGEFGDTPIRRRSSSNQSNLRTLTDGPDADVSQNNSSTATVTTPPAPTAPPHNIATTDGNPITTIGYGEGGTVSGNSDQMPNWKQQDDSSDPWGSGQQQPFNGGGRGGGWHNNHNSSRRPPPGGPPRFPPRGGRFGSPRGFRPDGPPQRYKRPFGGHRSHRPGFRPRF